MSTIKFKIYTSKIQDQNSSHNICLLTYFILSIYKSKQSKLIIQSHINTIYKLLKTKTKTQTKMKKRDKYQNQLLTDQTNKKYNLLQIQKDLLSKAIASNQSSSACWKIIVFDAYNRAIVSSQLKMKDLRDNYITLYLNIGEKREQIHGVTVMYLVEPVKENIQKIAQDLLDDMYTSVHVHFSSQPSRELLTQFAQKLVKNKKAVISKITKIQYSCVGYYPIDASMSILPRQNQIINMLTSLKLQPIFVYNPSNEQSKALIQALKLKLRPLRLFSEQTVSNNSNLKYALIYLFNRQNDQFPVLAHGITYASLMQNIYKINKTGSKVTKGKQTFQLSLQDQIWVNKKNYLVSEMKLGEQSNQISAKMIGISSEEYTQNNQKYKKIQWHLSNAGELIGEAKKRRLNEFYQIQLQLYYKRLVSKDIKRDMLSLLKQAPEAEDKVRLMLIYALYVDHLDQVQQLQQAFPQITKNTKYNEITSKKIKGTITESASNKYIKKFAKGIWKNIIPGDKKFKVTKQLQKIKGAMLSDLIQSGLAVQSIDNLPNYNNIIIQKNIIYCLGGACFHEYANLMQFCPDSIYTGDKLISYRQII